MCIRPHRTLDHRISEGLRSVTHKGISLLDRAFFKSSSHNDRFHNRSRLIGICHCKITPHAVQGFHRLLVIHRLDLFLRIHIAQISRFIQVITVSAIHSDDLTCGRVLHDHADLLRTHRFLETVHIFLYNLLCSNVNAGLDAFSIGRRDDRLFDIRLCIDISVLSSIHPCKGTVIISFQSDICHIPGQCKSNRVTSSLIKRIDPQIILLKPNPLHIRALLCLRFGQSRILICILILLKFFFLIHCSLLHQDLILALIRAGVRQ